MTEQDEKGRRSLAEVLLTSLKALEGLGLPHGLDHDGAANVVWLEARGLGGLSELAREVKNLEPGAVWQTPVPHDDGERIIIEHGSATGLLLATLAVDLAQTGHLVEIPDCRAPMLLVAETARRSAGGSGFKVSWASEQGSSSARCGDGEAALALDLRTAHAPATVTIRQGGKFSSRDGRRSAAFHAQSLRDGIAVDPAAWAVVASAAKRILVPASTQSRGGAGAEVDDNV